MVQLLSTDYVWITLDHLTFRSTVVNMCTTCFNIKYIDTSNKLSNTTLMKCTNLLHVSAVLIHIQSIKNCIKRECIIVNVVLLKLGDFY
jgi:hypothetical protein